MKVLLGFFWLTVLFGFCFFIVHITLWLLKVMDKAPHGFKPTNEPVPPPKEPQPIYYIVEKKSRKKNTYSPPREFKFEK